MIIKIAWKNIWRNPIRSLIVILSVVVGIWAGTFILAFVFGMMDQRLEDAIGYEISHVQFHHPDFLTDNEPEYVIPNSGHIISSLEKDSQVLAISGRIITYGMVGAANSSTGGKLIGIDPSSEDAVTKLGENIVEGEYLDVRERNKIIIGKKLADKLKVKIRSKVVLTFQDKSLNLVYGAFRVKGIYQCANASLEEVNLYVRSEDLSLLLANGGEVHEIAILLQEPDSINAFVSDMGDQYTALQVQSWKEISPDLAIMIDSMDQYMIIFLVIILLALSFGIVNTMLMAVLERVREIGVLMSIGMNNIRLFAMIFFETVFIVGLASPIGLFLAYSTVNYFGKVGLDVSGMYKEGYAAYGFKPLVYLQLDPGYYVQMLVMVAITAILASLYPAYSAVRLNPVKAIRKI